MKAYPWGEGVVLRPHGDLIEGVPCDDLERTLGELVGQGRLVIVDLGDVGLLSAHALGVLAQARTLAEERDARLALSSPRGNHRWLLERTGLEPALGLFETEAEAYASMIGAKCGAA